MKKAQLIEIAKQSFYIDDDAYKKLDKYLSGIGKHFTDKEVVADIELSIAEKLHTRLSKTRNVVAVEDVDSIISELGTIQDITGEPEPTTNEQEKNQSSTNYANKRLLRSKEHAQLGGVAAGIAAYLDIDRSLVRLLIIIAALFSFGSVIIAYLVLWALLPEAETIADEQAMHGKGATLKEIEETVKQKAQNLNDQHLVLYIKLPTLRLALYLELLNSYYVLVVLSSLLVQLLLLS